MVLGSTAVFSYALNVLEMSRPSFDLDFQHVDRESCYVGDIAHQQFFTSQGSTGEFSGGIVSWTHEFFSTDGLRSDVFGA